LGSLRARKSLIALANLTGVGFESEVACAEEADLGVGNIAPERFRSSGDEERVVLSPNR